MSIVNLEDLVREASRAPEPWSEGRTIPWDDPEFSARMLAEHLSQAHDAASRRSELIDQHIEFLQRVALNKTPSRILDLGCGPGLYTQKLAAAGHDCVGIDFAPASIEYARAYAPKGASLRYELGDIRELEFGDGFDLVMLLYGELNLFPREQAVELLRRCAVALAGSGRLVLEVHSFDFVRGRASAERRWLAAESGLFSNKPHLRLDQAYWLEAQATAAGRHWIVDATSGEVSLYGWCMQAYTESAYADLLRDAGLQIEARYESLIGMQDGAGFPVLVATKI
jgi:SAM-dependent methyltransferase